MPHTSRPRAARGAIALALSTTAACYHATLDTGRAASPIVVNKPWVSTFIFGLVPAGTINVAAQCPNGIARVETQQSFLNGFVGLITLGIYTPQSATITCAASGAGAATTGVLPTGSDTAPSVVVASDSSEAARAAAVNAAGRRAAATGHAVLVHL